MIGPQCWHTLVFSHLVAIACSILLSGGATLAGWPNHPSTLRVENVTVVPRDARTAVLQFDISWANSWRHEANHDAAWVLFKDARQPGGRLGSDPRTLPDQATWPNGYKAFYCMKYSISQGQFAAFLTSVASDLQSAAYNKGRYQGLPGEARRYHPGLCNFNGYTITTNAAGRYVADNRDRSCNFLSLPDILSYTAWAGLRPPTNLEYEKSCRGPRAVARAEDAWTGTTTAPAAGLLADGCVTAPAGASYWGIRELALSGCVQEWPATVQNELPTPTHKKGAGCEFKGTHGDGTPEAPTDWPWTAFGDWHSGGIWGNKGFGDVGIWIAASELDRLPDKWWTLDSDRTGRYGARAVRTAPPKDDRNSPLEVDRLPDLRGHDVSIFYLSGRFRNDGDRPLVVELAPALPDACFPEGGASRVFTAPPKAVTPFKVLTALTARTAADAVRGDGTLTVRANAKTSDGEVLARRAVRLLLTKPEEARPPAIGSLDGGELKLRLVNATDRAHALRIDLPSSPDLRLSRTARQVTVPAGGEAAASFPVVPQAFDNEAVRRIPYRVSVANGAPQDGETTVDLRIQSRWWVTRRIQPEPKLERESGEDATAAKSLLSDGVCPVGEVFRSAEPPHGWQLKSFGSYLPIGEVGQLPSRGSAAIAVTRLAADAHQEAVVVPDTKWLWKGRGEPPALEVLVWVNDEIVYNSTANEKKRGKPFRIRKTGNTLAVECRSRAYAPITPWNVRLEFLEAKGRNPLKGLVFDVNQR